MGDDHQQNDETLSELQKEMEKRKYWFYECQLRRLNMSSFRDILANSTDPLLNLITGPNGQTEKVYLDSQQPVWTDEEKKQRDLFHQLFIGNLGDWLDHKKPEKLAGKLAGMKERLEQSKFGSASEDLGELNKYGRKEQWKDDNNLPHILSRTAITAQRPWLIPEIFHYPNVEIKTVEDWVTNAEQFVSNYEAELMQYLGESPSAKPEFSDEKIASYREAMQQHIVQATQLPRPKGITIFYLEKLGAAPWVYKIQIATVDVQMKELWKYPHSENAKRWGYAFDASEIYLNWENSDMGLCTLMRALYLYGNLPAEWQDHELFTWREIAIAGKTYEEFVAGKITQAGDNADLVKRIQTASSHLKVLLELNAQNPCSADIRYSLVAESIYKYPILAYKFWLDEAFKAKGAKRLNDAKGDLGKEKDGEKEYWSENHYIMFASSEYLAGQLWPEHTFQPARDFLEDSEQDKGKLTGTERKERGRARVMNWLNNKLMFGWAEYNSSGYYREHLWALLNLADFALDKEIRQKATMVIDLMFFDVMRFHHKGAIGACGGRSQFKSKNNGWEGALSDVIEIMLGSKGVFTDASSQIGFAFASSTYKVPEVLLEIGKNPPATAFTDRSRVSISFEEAAKYGFQTSKKSDQKDSLDEAYRPKREKHYGPVLKVFDEITRTHRDYSRKEDDTIFWWGLSAYYNKQIVRNTFDCVEKFSLDKTGVFAGFLPFVVDFLLPFLSRVGTGALGGLALANTYFGWAPGVVLGVFSSEILGIHLEESSSDDLSIFLDGSTRSRTNIHTYKSRDIMLSTVQNFRSGQLNFQTQVVQATVSAEINVFITAFFEGLDISDLLAGASGGLLGAPLGMSALGAVGGIIANEALAKGENPLGKGADVDGPSYWTGHWALPMVVQHENAAILAFDSHWIQRRMAECGSHAWFPKNAFELTEEKRTSAYDNDNFFLADIDDIGAKGFWMFGKLTHGTNPQTGTKEEAYIGVFSNQPPEWLNKDSDFYEDKLEDQKIKSLKVDFFADRDWYVDEKNIWIIQVGSNQDFSSFDNFKDRVSKAKIKIDDNGDMECTYHVPDGAGNSRTLTLDYSDGGKFKLNGNGYKTDFYPRFENPFIRRGLAEWGQREWVIEYRGQSLLHDFKDWNNVVRQEQVSPGEDQLNRIKALVIYLRSGDEEMEMSSVAKATVRISCGTAATDEVIAAGETEEDSDHDAEWIFFDKEMILSPDMTIDIAHTGKGKPEWKMSYTLKALLGDHALWDCAVSFPFYHFKDERRSTGPVPFSVTQNKWSTWLMLDERSFEFYHIAEQAGYDKYYYSYVDVFAVDKDSRLWYLRLNACPRDDAPWAQVADDVKAPGSSTGFPWCSVSLRPDNLYLFLIKKDELWMLAKEAGSPSFAPWAKLPVETASHTTLFGFPAPDATRINVSLSISSKLKGIASAEFPFGVDLYITATDGNLYSVHNWFPFTDNLWRRIEVASTFHFGTPSLFEVWGNALFAVDSKQQLWAGEIDNSIRNISPDWQQLGPDNLKVSRFTLASLANGCLLLVLAGNGQIWTSFFTNVGASLHWERVGQTGNFTVSPQGNISCASASPDRADIFTTGNDGKIYTTFWTRNTGWEKSWTVAEKTGDIFKTSPEGKLISRVRVKGQIEVFTVFNKVLWKSWAAVSS